MIISGIARGILAGIFVACLASCEYEWKDEQGHVGDHSGAPHQDRPEAQPVVAPRKPPSNVRPVLAAGKEVSGTVALPKDAKQLNLTELAEKGALKVSTNDPVSQDLSNVYDEVETSLSRSADINPYVFTFDFSEPHNFKAARVLSSYSDYGWSIRVDGGERLVVNSVIDGEWSTVTWPEGVRGKRVVVEVLRIVRDNYVHVNEIALFE